MRIVYVKTGQNSSSSNILGSSKGSAASVMAGSGVTSGGFLSAEYEASVRQYLEAKRKEFEDKFKQSSNSAKSSVRLDDFDLDRTIGTGSFGRVMICYLKKDHTQRYAMKMLKKENIVKMKQVEHTLNEKKILSSIDFPFIVKMAYSFKDTTNLYMVSEINPLHYKFANNVKLYTIQKLVLQYIKALDSWNKWPHVCRMLKAVLVSAIYF